LPHLHASRPLLVLATSVGDITRIRSFRFGFDTVARLLGLAPPEVNGLHVPPMSSEWLRQHDADCTKHLTDR
jgi:hypothetical protein